MSLSRIITIGTALAAAAFLVALVMAFGPGRARSSDYAAARRMTGGDPHRGIAAMERYGCAACHIIPGVRGATSRVAPPLTSMASRNYIGGVLENRPENMIRWIMDPPAIDSKTAMPRLGVTEPDARDIASYLYTLK